MKIHRTYRNPTKKMRVMPIFFFGLRRNPKMMGKGKTKRAKSAMTANTPITMAEMTGLPHLANAVASQGAPFRGRQYIAAMAMFRCASCPEAFR